MRLIHFSNSPVELGELVARGQEESGDMKPRGLWLSDEDAECSWKWWCRQENFRLQMLTHVHRVTLSNCANICYLKTYQEIIDFGRAFLITHGPLGEMNARGIHYALDWVKVIQKWHGIVITPYVWEARLEHDASGITAGTVPPAASGSRPRSAA